MKISASDTINDRIKFIEFNLKKQFKRLRNLQQISFDSASSAAHAGIRHEPNRECESLIKNCEMQILMLEGTLLKLKQERHQMNDAYLFYLIRGLSHSTTL